MIHLDPRRLPFPATFDREVHDPSWLALPRDEVTIVHPVVLVACRQRGAFMVPVDAGAKTIRGRAYGAIKRAGGDTKVLLGKTGAAEPGTSDFLGTSREGLSIAIECKRPALIRNGRVEESAETPTQEQLRFLLEVWCRGGIAGVAWGSGDLHRIWNARLATGEQRRAGLSGVLGADHGPRVPLRGSPRPGR